MIEYVILKYLSLFIHQPLAYNRFGCPVNFLPVSESMLLHVYLHRITHMYVRTYADVCGISYIITTLGLKTTMQI